MGWRSQHIALAALVFFACGTEPGDQPADAIAAVDSTVPADTGAIADAIETDATLICGGDAGACNFDRTTTIPPDGPIGIGTFCDDLFVCVENRDVAETVSLVAPNFSCREQDTFDCPDSACAWQAAPGGGGPGSIDADELGQVCALTLLPALSSDVYCIVYL